MRRAATNSTKNLARSSPLSFILARPYRGFSSVPRPCKLLQVLLTLPRKRLRSTTSGGALTLSARRTRGSSSHSNGSNLSSEAPRNEGYSLMRARS